MNPIQWRFLIVEDKKDIAQQLTEIAPSFVDAPDSVEVQTCAKFAEAAEILKTENFDLLILDLKDDSGAWIGSDDEPAGLKLFEILKKTRFIPVVFYTAFAHKVAALQTNFVRVLRKPDDDVTKVRDEVRRVLATKLPLLNRKIEEVQRAYMWDFVSAHWKDFTQPADQADLAYLLARRLASALEAIASDLATQVGGATESPSAATKAHPMALYVVPPVGSHLFAGDIVSEKAGEELIYWLILTPSCEFAQNKAQHFTMAKCERLLERDEYKKWIEKKDDKTSQKLDQLIEDRGSERYKFLPRAFFIPDLVVDFQQLRSTNIDTLKSFNRVATLDSPFSESTIARFSRYFNRHGTPDLDKAIVTARFPVGKAAPAAPPPPTKA